MQVEKYKKNKLELDELWRLWGLATTDWTEKFILFLQLSTQPALGHLSETVENPAKSSRCVIPGNTRLLV